MKRVLAALLIAGCGGSSGGHPDGTVPARYQSEPDCAAPTPMADLSRKTEIQAWAGKTVRAAGNASTYRRGDDSMEVYLR